MILVTGGTGLLGAHLLLELLQTEEAIRAIYRTEISIKKAQYFFELKGASTLFLKIEWVQADIIDVPALERAFEGVKEVYHCAALVSFDPRDEEQLRKVNIEGTANLVNLSLAFNIIKFCHVSSIAALGDTIAKDRIVNEQSDWNPNKNHSDYAISKFGAEMEVWRGSQEGLPVVIVNPGVIFGPGFRNEGSAEMFLKVSRGFPFYTKGLAAVVGAEDVVRSMILLMQRSFFNQRFVVVAENIPYQELLNTIADLLNKKRPGLYASPIMTGFAWRLDYVVSLFTTKKRSFTQSLAKASHANFIYDSSKLKNHLSFSYTPIPRVLQMALKSYRP